MIERFESKIAFCPTTGCWLWIGNTLKGGYGLFKVNGKMLLAHRYAYEQAKGPIPAGLHIDHLCCVRCCVNPDHLEAVTPKENTLRSNAVSAINARKKFCPRCGSAFGPQARGRCCYPCRNMKQRERRHRASATGIN